jgi:hypothetical protein
VPAIEPHLDRRSFLGGALICLLWPHRALAADEAAQGLSEAALDALPGSEFVYVSPLKSDGSESSCHAEVWYAWLDDQVVLITGSDRWKARSVAGGLDRARIWVGDYGPWKRGPLESSDFRKGPSFVARARTSQDPELLERMLVVYEKKYPDGIGKWRDRFREGLASGERILVLYKPAA